MNARRRWERIRSWISVTAFCGLALSLPMIGAGCSQAPKATAEENAHPVVVEVDVPHTRELTREIDQPGWLRPFEQTPIYAKIAGFAKEPKVDRGDRVKKDELLLELYLPEVVQQLRVKGAKVKQTEADLLQAKEAERAARAGVEAARADIDAKFAAIQSAQAQVRRWQAEDERSRRLVDRGIYDQQTADEVVHQLQASEALRDEAKAKWSFAKSIFDQSSAQDSKALADIQVADANVKVAQADEEQWREWLSYCEIRAPYDGVITRRHVHTGHFLQPSNSGNTTKSGEPLFMMMSTHILRLTLEVPELDANLIKTERTAGKGYGDKARVRFQTKNGGKTEIWAQVTRDSVALDERNRTLTVEIWLDNADGKLLPYTYANVTIFAKLPNVLTLPAEAILNDILEDGDRSYVYVVEDNKVHKTFVDIGARGDEGVQILRKSTRPKGPWEPFTGKEKVVVVNPAGLLDGQEVQIKKPE